MSEVERPLTLREVQLPLRAAMAKAEVEYLERLLSKYPPHIKGNISRAARESGINQGNLSRLIKLYGQQRQRWMSHRGRMAMMFVQVGGMPIKIGGRPITDKEAQRAQDFEDAEIDLTIRHVIKFIEESHRTGCASLLPSRVHGGNACTCKRAELLLLLKKYNQRGLVFK